jgi:hypothetical protein
MPTSLKLSIIQHAREDGEAKVPARERDGAKAGAGDAGRSSQSIPKATGLPMLSALPGGYSRVKPPNL